MELFYGTDHIKKLSLSVRSSNALCRAGIFHIGDLLNLSEKDLYDLPRIGKASANEILCVCARLKFGEDCSYSDTGSVPSATAAQASESHPLSSDLCMSSVPCFVDSYGNLKRDIPVCKLALSRSAHSDLIKADIQYVSQLFGQYGDDIPDNHKIRSRTMAEIRSILADTTYERLSPQEVYGWRYEAHDLAMAIIGNLSEASCVPTRFIYGIILALCLEYIGLHPAAVPAEALEDDRFIQQIYILPPIYNLLLQHMQNVVDATDFGVSDKALAEKMPRHFQDSELVAHLIESAISRSAITRNKDGLLERKYPTILEYVDSIPSVRSRAIVLGRLQGKSFRALGAEYGLTPERIRQVLEKAMRNHPKVAEDRYAKIFQTYSIQKEDFIRAFQESEICYQYLKITYKAGRQPPEALIVNNAFPPSSEGQPESAVKTSSCFR